MIFNSSPAYPLALPSPHQILVVWIVSMLERVRQENLFQDSIRSPLSTQPLQRSILHALIKLVQFSSKRKSNQLTNKMLLEFVATLQ
jgi:hypothetical protein